jgi:hypothetical protein
MYEDSTPEETMPAQFPHGRALVIGVANYQNVSKLPSEVLKDARDVALVLQHADYCAYPPAHIELLLDGGATADGIRKGLRRLAQSAGPDDTAMVFFSGHGGRVESGPDAGTYLIPFDCNPGHLRDTAIGSEDLTRLLREIKAKRLVVLLDACHSAGAGEVKAIAPLADVKAGLDEKIYDALAQGAGRIIMASSRSTEVSLILRGMPNSLFTHYLLEALKGASVIPGDDVIRVFNVFHYVSDKVPADAPTQHPIFKAHEVETNFPLALYLGGKQAIPASGQGSAPAPAVRPKTLSPKARIAIKKGLVRRWDDLADYFAIPLADRATFQQGYEPQRVLEWLEERKRLGDLRDAFNYLGYDDLIEELDRHPM